MNGVHGRQEIMSQEQHTDGALKHLLSDWESTLDMLSRQLQAKINSDLAADKFPQTASMTAAFEAWRKQFEDEWENLSQHHSFQAKLSQQAVTSLQAEVRGWEDPVGVSLARAPIARSSARASGGARGAGA